MADLPAGRVVPGGVRGLPVLFVGAALMAAAGVAGGGPGGIRARTALGRDTDAYVTDGET